ncbi:MAG: polysaccharide lyase family 7 protein [Anaerolineae bacterium]
MIFRNKFSPTILVLLLLIIVSCTTVDESDPADEVMLISEATSTIEIAPTSEATATPAPTEAPACTPTMANLMAYDEGLNDGHGPDLAVDGDYADVESRWSADGEGRWIILDIGGPGTVTELATAWYKGDERTAFFDVDVSLDGVDWTTVSNWARSQGDAELSSISLGDVNARYVRIVGRGNSSNTWNSLLEAQIQTCGDVIPGPPPTVPPTATPAPTPLPLPSPIPSGNDIPDIILNGTLWDLEGADPHPLVDPQTLVFVPLETQFMTPNGNGWRHEYKIKKSLRVAMAETYEEFQAIIKVELSDGGKTIVTQYHAGGTGTIMKVYVSDSSEKGFFDSQAANGVFDVYVRLRNTAGIEQKFALGTIESGDSFSLRVVNNYGVVRVDAFGEAVELEVEDSEASFLKFGNYLQSQSPIGNVNCGEKGNSNSFAECYAQIGITKSVVTMTDVTYTRMSR